MITAGWGSRPGYPSMPSLGAATAEGRAAAMKELGKEVMEITISRWRVTVNGLAQGLSDCYRESLWSMCNKILGARSKIKIVFENIWTSSK